MHLHLVTIHAMPSPQAVPLAAACLKAYLDAQPDTSKHQVTTAEFFSGAPLNHILNSILSAKADIIGFPMYVWNRAECSLLAKMLREACPSTTITAGGSEATADPIGVLNEAPFDFLVVGEGEATMVQVMNRLASSLPIDQTAGIATRINGEIVVNKRPSIADLGLLTSPYLAGILDTHIESGVVWQLSRGCSFGCDFCFDGMGDRKVRRYPIERLEQELDYFVERDVSQIFILDSTFNQDVKRAKTLLRLIEKKAPNVHCHFEVRHELLDAEQAKLFSKLTCSLQIGLQSADPEVARNSGRKLDRNDFAAKIALLNEAGTIFGFDLIYGLPGDTLHKFREGLDFALSLYPNHLDIFPLSVLPGTALASRAKELQFTHITGPPYTLLESPPFPASDMATAKRLASACDIFYSRGKAVAWFNSSVTALRLAPVAFLESFADWLLKKKGTESDEADYSDEDIRQFQKDFLTEIFHKRKMARLLAPLLDIVDYHYHYAKAVMAVPPRPLTEKELAQINLLKQPIKIAESAHLAIFKYNILELLEAGEPDFEEFASFYKPTGSFAVIYPSRGEVFTESLAEPYYRLLERLDGFTSAKKATELLGIPADEALEFLEFAIDEGIVTTEY